MMNNLRTYLQTKGRLIYCVSMLILAVYFLQRLFFPQVLSGKMVASSSSELQRLEQQLKKIEVQLKEHENTLPDLYQKLLYGNGRFTYRTIVLGNGSRLCLADAVLRSPGRSGEKYTPVSRAYKRYDDTTFDITNPSAVTAYELNQVFRNTPMHDLGAAFVQAELETGVNAIFLSAIAAHESSWGRSALAAEKNNLFGFGAYDHDPNLAMSFASKSACVIHVANFLRTHYIDGSYARGHAIADINKLYASDQTWSKKIFSTMCKIDETIQQKALE